MGKTYVHKGGVIDIAVPPAPAGLRIEAWDESGISSDLIGVAIAERRRPIRDASARGRRRAALRRSHRRGLLQGHQAPEHRACGHARLADMASPRAATSVEHHGQYEGDHPDHQPFEIRGSRPCVRPQHGATVRPRHGLRHHADHYVEESARRDCHAGRARRLPRHLRPHRRSSDRQQGLRRPGGRGDVRRHDRRAGNALSSGTNQHCRCRRGRHQSRGQRDLPRSNRARDAVDGYR